MRTYLCTNCFVSGNFDNLQVQWCLCNHRNKGQSEESYKMAGSNYNYDKSNPFFATEDVDDETFLRSGRRGQGTSSVEDRHMQLLEERRKIEERTLQSSYRSIGLLHESEAIGAATAEVFYLRFWCFNCTLHFKVTLSYGGV